MTPAIAIALGWILFGGSHLVISSSGLRGRIVDRKGPLAFTLIFAAVSATTMAVLIGAVVVYGNQGLPGPNLSQSAVIKSLAAMTSVIGVTLMIAGLANYPKSPMAVLANRQGRSAAKQQLPLAEPTALERLSRHPFFVGLILTMSAHTLMASTLASAVFFAGFVVTAAVGIRLQDRKLQARWQDVYREYLDKTGVVPSPASFPKRQLSWKLFRPQLLMLIVSLGVAVLLFAALHGFWSYANGAVFPAALLLFGLLATLAAIARRRKT